MRPIQMVDLPGQYLRLKTEFTPAIENVLISGAYIKGPDVATFEKDLSAYIGAKHVIGCANGTDALQIAFMALNLQPGDEVITPSFGYAAVAEVIHLLGLKPVFAEVNPDTFLLDPASMEAAITPATKAIAPVHLYGQVADMEKILEIAARYHLYVVEDTAQAIGAVYTFSNGRKAQAGTMGDIGTTSFFPTKNLGCYGDGGAVFTQNDDLAKTMKMIANHGQQIKYKHEIIGINSRLDTLQAAILEVKLKHLPEFESARNACANWYDRELASCHWLKLPVRNPSSTHVFHQYTMVVQDNEMRDGLKKYLAEKSIPTMVYYPTPLHQQQAYRQEISMPLTEDLCSRVLSLPIHTEMDETQLSFITETIKEFFHA